MTKSHFFLFLGIIFILVGLFLNEWILAALFSSDGILLISQRIIIWVFDLTMILIGTYFIFYRQSIQPLNLLLFSVTCILCLIGAEIFLRIIEKDNKFVVFRENPSGKGSYRLRPNLDYVFNYEINGEHRRFIIKTNSHGMRWREVEKEKPAGKKRIAFVGDSFTFGESADRIENSFVGVFDSLIDKSQYEVLNFGVDGYGLDDMELQIREEVLQFDPDYIILMFFNGNDFRDTYLGLNKFDISSGIAVWNRKVLQNKRYAMRLAYAPEQHSLRRK